MAKTQDELNQLKTEYETLTNKLKELTEDELKIVIGGLNPNHAYYRTLPDCPFSVIERMEQDYDKCIYKDQYKQCEECLICKSDYKVVSQLHITPMDW